MVIDIHTLSAGDKLVSNYKGVERSLEVSESAEGLRYTLDDGQEFKSLSSAGKAVTGRVSCQGTLFWSIPGTKAVRAPRTPKEAKEPKAAKEPKVKSARKKAASGPPQISLVRSQKDVPEGQKRWFCSACMKSFFMPAAQTPDECPEGHPRLIVKDDFASTPAEAEATTDPIFEEAEAEASTEPVDELFAEPANA